MRISRPIVFKNYIFTRATIANYYNAAGIITEAGIDELRLGYDPATLDFIGPIIEGEVENQLFSSNEFRYTESGTKWNSDAGITITPASGTSPDGTNNATLIHLVTGPTPSFYQSGFSGIDCFSIYVKQASFSSDAIIRISLGGIWAEFNISLIDYEIVDSAIDSHPFIQVLQDGWFRISIAGTVAFATANVGYASGSTDDFYVFGAQLETTSSDLGFKPTSYIETTTTTETRAADNNLTTPPRVVSSNVPPLDYDQWDSGDSYTADNQVTVQGVYNRNYESVGSNTNKFPPDNPEEWIDQGATNRWRMFDMHVGADKQTVSEGSDNSVNVLLDVSQRVNTIVLLNVEASNVTITMRNSDGDVVYTHYEVFLQPPSGTGWWNYFFGMRRRATTLALVDLPNVSPSTIEMILDGGSDAAKIGKMIVGDGLDIGCTRYSTGLGIIDFSRKERDEFGNYFILERRYVSRCDFDIQLLTSRVDEIFNLLASLRATPVVYIGDENYRSTVVYGFYRDFSIVLSGPKRSDCTLQVESI